MKEVIETKIVYDKVVDENGWERWLPAFETERSLGLMTELPSDCWACERVQYLYSWA